MLQTQNCKLCLVPCACRNWSCSCTDMRPGCSNRFWAFIQSMKPLPPCRYDSVLFRLCFNCTVRTFLATFLMMLARLLEYWFCLRDVRRCRSSAKIACRACKPFHLDKTWAVPSTRSPQPFFLAFNWFDCRVNFLHCRETQECLVVLAQP